MALVRTILKSLPFALSVLSLSTLDLPEFTHCGKA